MAGPPRFSSDSFLPTFTVLLVVSATALYAFRNIYSDIFGDDPVHNGNRAVSWLGRGDTNKGSRYPWPSPGSVQFSELPKEMPAGMDTNPCLGHDRDMLIALANTVLEGKVLVRSKLWACSVLYEHYGITPSGWRDEFMLQQDFLTAEYRLYLRDTARAELVQSNGMCQRFFGLKEGEIGTKYLGAGSYGLAYSRILSQAAPRPLPTFPSQPANSNGGGEKSPRRRPQRSASQEDSSEYRDPHGYGCRAWRDYDCTRYARSHEKFTEKQVEELNKNCPAACSHGTANEAEVVDNLTDRERAVVKVAGLDLQANVKSATLEAGLDVSVEGYYQEAMSHVVEAGMPHVAIGYGVWICDDFESMKGSENLLYPDLDCHKQSHDNNNRSKTSEHPSFSERVASCTVLKEEIRTGVMSPNMQVLMLEQIHLSFKQALRLMSSELPNAAMVTLAQRAFFFQLAFTVTSLQRVFGDSYKHNDLMLGNIRSTYPQWLGSVVNGVKYAAGGRMAAPISNGKPLSYFKYQLDGKAYTVPNFGFNLRLADYDFSQSSQNNRTRNPKVEWIKRERQCGKRIEDDNWSSACRTVKVADANGASSDSEPVGSSEGARLVYRAKAALAQLKAMSWLNDSLDFICAKTSFTCQKWREVGCHNAVDDYELDQEQLEALQSSCKRTCTNVDLHLIALTADGAAVPTMRMPAEPTSRQDSGAYRDPKGYKCNAWQGYDCEKEARSNEGYTEEQVEELYKNCPAACSRDTVNEAEVVDNGGHVLMRFGGSSTRGSLQQSATPFKDGQVVRAKVLKNDVKSSSSSPSSAQQFAVELTMPALQMLASISNDAAQTMLDGLKGTPVCFLKRESWVQRGPLLKRTKSSKQHFELVLEQHGERAGPRRHHVIRLVDPADGLERDYKLLNQEGKVKVRGGKSIVKWSVMPYNQSHDLDPVSYTATNVQLLDRKSRTYSVREPQPWRGYVDGFGYIYRVPSVAPFLHFYQEGIVPTANKRLDLHFVLNAVLGHSSTYKKVLKGAVWDWLESLLNRCDKCNETLSKTVFASRMSNGMECRYCESANITALTTDSPAIQGFPLPEDVVASNFFAQFRGEGVWEKADNARQVLGVINADALPRDLGKIHNGALSSDGVAAPFPSDFKSDGPVTGEGTYVL